MNPDPTVGLGSKQPSPGPSGQPRPTVGLGSNPASLALGVPAVRTWGLGSTASPAPWPGPASPRSLERPGLSRRRPAGTPAAGLSRPASGPGINNPMESQDTGTPGSERVAFPTGDLLRKSEAARFLGVSHKTINRYMKRGLLRSWKNEVNGRVYYDRADLLRLLGSRLPQSREVWVYCRAARLPDQGSAGVAAEIRLERQVERVLNYCTAAGVRVDKVVKEISRADSLQGRTGLDKIMEAVLKKELSCLVIECPDRLARFAGGEIIERFLLWHGVELHVIQKELSTEEYREEIKEDLARILFSAKQLMGD